MGKVVLFGLLGVLVLGASGCRREHTRIDNHANARREAAERTALREWVYKSCSDPERPRDTACGLIAGEFFSPASLKRFVAERCGGEADDRCERALVASWIDKLAERYHAADTRKMVRFCQTHPAPCEDPPRFEVEWRESHNANVLEELRAKKRAIAANRQGEHAAENKRQREALAQALQNMGRSMRGRNEVLLASCRTYSDCPVGFRCDGRVCVR